MSHYETYYKIIFDVHEYINSIDNLIKYDVVKYDENEIRLIPRSDSFLIKKMDMKWSITYILHKYYGFISNLNIKFEERDIIITYDTTNYFEKLDELQCVQIFRYLDERTLNKLFFTCNKFLKLSQNQMVWSTLFTINYPSLSKNGVNHVHNWRMIYKYIDDYVNMKKIISHSLYKMIDPHEDEQYVHHYSKYSQYIYDYSHISYYLLVENIGNIDHFDIHAIIKFRDEDNLLLSSCLIGYNNLTYIFNYHKGMKNEIVNYIDEHNLDDKMIDTIKEWLKYYILNYDADYYHLFTKYFKKYYKSKNINFTRIKCEIFNLIRLPLIMEDVELFNISFKYLTLSGDNYYINKYIEEILHFDWVIISDFKFIFERFEDRYKNRKLFIINKLIYINDNNSRLIKSVIKLFDDELNNDYLKIYSILCYIRRKQDKIYKSKFKHTEVFKCLIDKYEHLLNPEERFLLMYGEI